MLRLRWPQSPQIFSVHFKMSVTPTADPVVKAYARDVDRSILRENLKLTVEERFLRFEAFMEGVEALRGAVAKRSGRRPVAPASQ